MYSSIRKTMAEKFSSFDFGSPDMPPTSGDTSMMSKEELLIYKRNIENLAKQKKERYTRIKNKIKELRRGYKNAIDSGTRSGSGRLIHENFDSLQEIWGGSPAVTAMAGGISSIGKENTHDNSLNLLENDIDNIEDELQHENDSGNTQGMANINPTQPPVVDNKRKHMQKKISSHQREMMMLDLAKKELEMKEMAVNTLRQSAESTERILETMTSSITSIGDNIKEGMILLAQSFIQSSTPQFHMPANYSQPMQPIFNVQTPVNFPNNSPVSPNVNKNTNTS